MKYSTYRTTSATTSTPSISTSGVRGKTTWSGWNTIDDFSRQIISFSSCTELFKYLDTNFGGFLTNNEKENINILTWWKGRTRNFSILSIMTRDLLTPPASTVALKAVFSAGNRQMDKRNSLSPEILECQICVKDWDDPKYRIQQEVTKDNYVLKPFNNMDLLDDYRRQ